ncbi:MAG: hypothetical protein FJ125_05355 [Deltaproteobacteria bacterium]|nr:hypothetical protein [Deltaproteobacteria bacterium]
MFSTPNHSHPLLLCTLLACAVSWTGCGGSSKNLVSTEHTQKVLAATAAAEEDLHTAQQLMKEQRYIEALRSVLNRLKALDTQIYDAYKLKSQAYLAGHLPAVQGIALLIGELEKVEDALLQYLNEPLSIILERILLSDPDPRAREEALDIIAGSANEIFTQFRSGYRQDLLDNLVVRVKSENNLGLRTKMLKIIETLNSI